MKNPYYAIIASGFVGARNNDPGGFKIMTFITASVMGILNLFAIFIWLNALGVVDMPNLIVIHVINEEASIDWSLHGLLNYGIFSAIIHYFIIYYKDNYKRILLKYPQKNGKLMIIYIIASCLFLAASGFTTAWLRDIGIISEFTKMKPLIEFSLF